MLECILFDLDNTLYPKSLGIFDMVVERIRHYMEKRMGFEKTLARDSGRNTSGNMVPPCGA